MNYWQFRLTCYRDTLRQWVDSIKQLSLGLVALFPLALMAMIFIPLLVLGILADPQTSNHTYFTALWGYLLLLHSWLLLQKDGIKATRYSYYDASLPITLRHRYSIDVALIFYAGNLLLCAPIALLSLLLLRNSDSVSVSGFWQFIPILGLVLFCTYYAFVAVYRRYPWFSLLVLPLCLLPVSTDLSKTSMLTLWLLACICEFAIPRFTHFSLRFSSVPSFFFLTADSTYYLSQFLRLVALLLVLLFADSFVTHVNEDMRTETGNFFAFVCALIVASKMLELTRLQRRYRGYLVSVGLTRFQRYRASLVYLGVYALPSLLLIGWFQVFNGANWTLYFVCFIATTIGIVVSRKYFLAYPIITAFLYWVYVTKISA